MQGLSDVFQRNCPELLAPVHPYLSSVVTITTQAKLLHWSNALRGVLDGDEERLAGFTTTIKDSIVVWLAISSPAIAMRPRYYARHEAKGKRCLAAPIMAGG